MFDLIVKEGTLPDGNVVDIGIRRDRIAEVGRIEPSVMELAGRVIDAGGDLVCPPFVDPHFHMDAILSYGLPRVNASGTLLEGIALWGELREIATVDEMVERALCYCDWAVSMGLLAIRSHVDTTPDHLRGVEATLEVRRQVAPYIDLQLVAFPQDGLYRSPTGRENLIRALDMGCDVVGGIPHFERTMADGAESVRDVARIAAERGLVKVWLATGHTDMRKGFPGLSLMVQEALKRDPMCGHLFVFRGRGGGLIKVIWHDGQGACLFTKKLERGRFIWPSAADGTVVITPAQLGYLLEGIDWRMPQKTWRPTSAG